MIAGKGYLASQFLQELAMRMVQIKRMASFVLIYKLTHALLKRRVRAQLAESLEHSKLFENESAVFTHFPEDVIIVI